MSDMLKIAGKLALICAVAALCLGAVNMVTEPKIAEIKAAKLEAALKKVAPDGTIGSETPADDPVVMSYYPVENSGETAGYILNLKGSGYGGDLILLASYLPDGKLFASVLMDNDETPGLGKEGEKDWYMKKYLGFIGRDIPTVKSQLPQEEADAISGATITFAGIGNALVAGSEYVIGREGAK